MPSRALDLAALGLAAEENDETAIRRAFLRKSRTAHPDKGGTNEEFVALRDAYERLQKNVYAASALPARASQNNHGWHGASAGACGANYEQYSEEGESHYEWYDRDWFDELRGERRSDTASFTRERPRRRDGRGGRTS